MFQGLFVALNFADIAVQRYEEEGSKGQTLKEDKKEAPCSMVMASSQKG
jgi:hypothetical protein